MVKYRDGIPGVINADGSLDPDYAQAVGIRTSKPQASIPAPLESDIQAQALRKLRQLRDLGMLMVVRVNSGKLVGKYDASEPGMSDVVLGINGKVVFLEFKRPGGRLSPDQVRFRRDCERSGNAYRVVESVADVDAVLREFGVEL